MDKFFTIGAWFVKPSQNLLVLEGQSYSVEPLAMDVLIYFVEHPEKVISTDELVDSVWKGRIVGDHAVYRIINQLRKTLKEDSGKDYIKTIRKKGYQLNQNFSETITFVSPKTEANLKTQETIEVESGSSGYLQWITLFGALSVSIIILIVLFLNKNKADHSLQYKALKPLSVLNGEEKDPEFSPEEKFVAFSHRAGPRDNYKIYIQPTRRGAAIPITQGGGDDVSPSWSPDRKNIVFVRMKDDSCQIMQVAITEDGNEASKILDCNNHGIPNEVVWGKDDYIYYNNAETSQEPYKIFRYYLKTGRKEQLTNPEVGYSKGDIFFTLSKDRKYLAYKRDLNWGPTQVEVLDLKNKKTKKLFELIGWQKGLSWSKDGKHLFYVNSDNEIMKYDFKEDSHSLISKNQISIHALAAGFQSDSLLVMVGDVGSDILISAVGSSVEEKFISSSEIEVYPEFANTSMKVAFLSNRSGRMQIWLKSAKGDYMQLTHFEDKRRIHRIRWSPNDNYLVSSYRNKLYVINVDNGEETLVWEGPSHSRIEAPSWSEDGNHIFFSSNIDEDWQTYKVNFLRKGSPIKVTDEGSYGAIELNNDLIYFKYHHSGLWLKDMETNKESKLVGDTDVFAYDSLYSNKKGFYYIAIDSDKGNGLKYYNMSDSKVEDIMPVTNSLIDLSISYKDEWVLFPKVYRDETAIKLLESSNAP